MQAPGVLLLVVRACDVVGALRERIPMTPIGMAEQLEIDPRRTAIVAVDFQNDIVGAEGAFGLFGAEVERVTLIPAAARLLGDARAAGVKIVYSRGTFQSGYPELVGNIPVLRMVAEYGCLVDGTPGAAIIDAVAPHGEDVVLTHHGSVASTAPSSMSCCVAPGSTRLFSSGLPLTWRLKAQPEPGLISAIGCWWCPMRARPPPRLPTTHHWNPSQCWPKSCRCAACSPRSPRSRRHTEADRDRTDEANG